MAKPHTHSYKENPKTNNKISYEYAPKIMQYKMLYLTVIQGKFLPTHTRTSIHLHAECNIINANKGNECGKHKNNWQSKLHGQNKQKMRTNDKNKEKDKRC